MPAIWVFTSSARNKCVSKKPNTSNAVGKRHSCCFLLVHLENSGKATGTVKV